ncbi:recombinase family protein [Methylorubrum zatmanii]|uniref:Recombinase family protein n=1 Tax=Methylorubrum zatmanii TaxID=29429 RepID=A0ABW1WQS1_9HYPH|nr:recombinase family protein [Methylorubrum zatmanii]MBD8905266.1 resolvase [Methylorubrum zatmanii]
MSSDLFVSYLRPGHSAQGASGDALATQREAVVRHLGRRGRLVAEIVETGSGVERPGLNEALALCRRDGATLLMAELGSSGEDPAFLRDLGAALRRLGLRFAAIDRPEVSELTLGIMAAVAEAEQKLGVSRTPETMARRREFYARFTAERRARAAVPAAQAEGAEARPLSESRGRGGALPSSRERAEDVAPILSEIRAAGALTLEQVANALNALGIPSARGNRWYPMQVTRIEKRLAAVR